MNERVPDCVAVCWLSVLADEDIYRNEGDLQMLYISPGSPRLSPSWLHSSLLPSYPGPNSQ
jgi:hypothetical protein